MWCTIIVDIAPWFVVGDLVSVPKRVFDDWIKRGWALSGDHTLKYRTKEYRKANR